MTAKNRKSKKTVKPVASANVRIKSESDSGRLVNNKTKEKTLDKLGTNIGLGSVYERQEERKNKIKEVCNATTTL